MINQKVVLFTNLQYVSVGKVRTHCQAMIVEQTETILNPNEVRYRVRGFGPDPAWPVFDLDVDSFAFKLDGAASDKYFMMVNDEGPPKPLFSGHIMTFPDGTKIEMVLADNSQKIRIDVFEGADCYQDVWRLLYAAPAKYARAPYIPVLQWVSREARAEMRYRG